MYYIFLLSLRALAKSLRCLSATSGNNNHNNKNQVNYPQTNNTLHNDVPRSSRSLQKFHNDIPRPSSASFARKSFPSSLSKLLPTHVRPWSWSQAKQSVFAKIPWSLLQTFLPPAIVQPHHGEPGVGPPTVAADLRHQVFVPLYRAWRHVFSRLRGSRVHRNIPAVLLHGSFGSIFARPGIYFVRALADEAAEKSSVLFCLLIFFAK